MDRLRDTSVSRQSWRRLYLFFNVGLDGTDHFNVNTFRLLTAAEKLCLSLSRHLNHQLEFFILCDPKNPGSLAEIKLRTFECRISKST